MIDFKHFGRCFGWKCDEMGLLGLVAGLILVVSPLLSLMRDQVKGLRKRGVRAVQLASDMSVKEQRAAVWYTTLELPYRCFRGVSWA